MAFPLIKTWLRPLLGSSSRDADKYRTPEGFRTIGGGGGGNNPHRRGTQIARGPNPLTNVSFTESEERIVNGIKLQNMAVAASVAQGNHQSNTSVVVRTNFDVSEDRTSQHSHNATCIHEPWEVR
jgi:hypothetical protein